MPTRSNAKIEARVCKCAVSGLHCLRVQISEINAIGRHIVILSLYDSSIHAQLNVGPNAVRIIRIRTVNRAIRRSAIRLAIHTTTITARTIIFQTICVGRRLTAHYYHQMTSAIIRERRSQLVGNPSSLASYATAGRRIYKLTIRHQRRIRQRVVRRRPHVYFQRRIRQSSRRPAIVPQRVYRSRRLYLLCEIGRNISRIPIEVIKWGIVTQFTTLSNRDTNARALSPNHLPKQKHPQQQAQPSKRKFSISFFTN